ncbi:MAG: LysM peptidoglycan-binding domain-containing protein [Christensenellaceae bacterium]|nr:LysM peptidoglycan-binding domain-containing protein [Christensenellaceae bacterium]
MTLSEYEYTDAVSTVGEGGKTRPEDTAPTPPKTYTVVYGDTLWSIARRFLGKGSLYTLIAKVNNMPDPNILRVGQVLVIPEVP